MPVASSTPASGHHLPFPESTPNGHKHPIGISANGHSNESDAVSSKSEDEDLPLSQSANNTAAGSKAHRKLKRKKAVYSDSSSDEDAPLASSPMKRAPAMPTSMPGNVNSPNGKSRHAGHSGNDDIPIAARKAKKPPKKKLKEKEDDSDMLSDNDKPIVNNKPANSRRRKLKAVTDTEEEASNRASISRGKKIKNEDGSPNISKTTKRATKKDVNGSSLKAEEEEQEQEEVFKWWESEIHGDGTAKWQTLEHNGVLFPPPYEPLPEHVKMKYNEKEIKLLPAAEEVAGFYAAMLETDHAQDATFNKNFFEDWKIVMKEHPIPGGTKITSFDLCDFRPMFDYFEGERAKKKAMSAREKKEAKKEKDDIELKYTTCLLDGRKEKIGNFRVEPPGLFRGRGDHPKKGALKFRVRPEDITINIGKDAPIPVPNAPGTWKAITHDNTVTWLANWTENVNGNHKYVFLAAGSSLKGQSDMIKFEKARELKNHVDRIRQNYTRDLRSKIMADRQRATAMYFIDRLALRAGNEKGEDEADTVGCCSLRCEHVTLEAPSFIIFDFLGKDSIRYYKRIEVEAQVFKNIRIFKENKNDDDNLFDRVNTTSLNKHLQSEMKGLTAKVFRTFNASSTFQRLLDEDNLDGATLQEKLNAYNKANRMVAILCNHQRSAPKTHDQSMEKMRYKYRSIKYEKMKLRHALFAIEPKFKKNKKFMEDESDIDDEWIAIHEENLKAKEIERAEKKFTKDNEKLAEEGKTPHSDKVLRERIQMIEEDFKRLAGERGTSKATLKRERPVEKLEEAIDKLQEKVKSFALQIEDRDAGKEVALGTSKINYLDPRITVAWCKTYDVPLEKLFSKTLVTKFPWAMEAEQDWKF